MTHVSERPPFMDAIQQGLAATEVPKFSDLARGDTLYFKTPPFGKGTSKVHEVFTGPEGNREIMVFTDGYPRPWVLRAPMWEQMGGRVVFSGWAEDRPLPSNNREDAKELLSRAEQQQLTETIRVLRTVIADVRVLLDMKRPVLAKLVIDKHLELEKDHTLKQ